MDTPGRGRSREGVGSGKPVAEKFAEEDIAAGYYSRGSVVTAAVRVDVVAVVAAVEKIAVAIELTSPAAIAVRFVSSMNGSSLDQKVNPIHLHHI